MTNANLVRLSDARDVLLEIKHLAHKREELLTIRSFTNFQNVSIIFSASNSRNVAQMICLNSSMLPFHLSNELVNILEDAVDIYSRDISSLNQHLKTL